MNRIRKRIAAFLLAAVLAAAACFPAFAAKPAESMSSSVNALNWKFFDATVGKDNLFYSPYSLETAFAMADFGAAGRTRTQMDDVLGISDLDAFAEQYRAYAAKEQPDTAKLTSANSIWVNSNKASLSPSYLADMQKKMNASVRTEPFSKQTSAHIQAWAADATNGLIPDYKPVVQTDSVADLLNAVYFYGEWESPFDKYMTYTEPFTNADGVKQNVSMMHQNKNSYRYYAADGFRGLELPYKNSSIVMDLILPAGETDITVARKWASCSGSERDDFLNSLGTADRRPVSNLALPKFKCDRSFDNLPEIMRLLGMTDAFDSCRADFSNMGRDLYLSDASHRAVLEVDELGSRAAAVTEIAVNEKAMLLPDNAVSFCCDIPFVYCIRDTSNGMVLFTGVMNRV